MFAIWFIQFERGEWRIFTRHSQPQWSISNSMKHFKKRREKIKKKNIRKNVMRQTASVAFNITIIDLRNMNSYNRQQRLQNNKMYYLYGGWHHNKLNVTQKKNDTERQQMHNTCFTSTLLFTSPALFLLSSSLSSVITFSPLLPPPRHSFSSHLAFLASLSHSLALVFPSPIHCSSHLSSALLNSRHPNCVGLFL